MSMRQKRLGFFVIASLCSWIVISYFLFMYCPNCHKDKRVNQTSGFPNDGSFSMSEDELEVQKLENKIQLLARDYNKMLEEFKKIVMKKKASLLLSKLRTRKESYENEKNKLEDTQNKNNQILNFNSIYNNTSALELKMREISGKKLKSGEPVIAILVLSCNRVTVKQCLDALLQWRPSKEQFPIIVSQDCMHQPTIDAILSYGDEITLIQQPDQSEIIIPPKEKKFKGYFKIARHYGWALNQTFFNFKFDTAIVVEDDLTIAPDFYEYFLGTYWLLKADTTLWCVSAWNDNGKSDLIDKSQPGILHRTDFFPGLGWMLTSSLWAELSVKWPKSYWDDWIRKPDQRKDRACIRPELSRTKTFGKVGVSNGMFFEKHLKYIKLNTQYVSFTKMNLSYLLKDIYDEAFVKDVYRSPVVSYQELRNGHIVYDGPVRILYSTKDQYKKIAKFIGLMDDFRSGVPRTAYRGVVTFSYKGRRVYLAPHSNWKAYDITWS